MCCRINETESGKEGYIHRNKIMAGDDSTDKLFVSELRNGPRLNVVKEMISMGANPNTSKANCLVLCLEKIEDKSGEPAYLEILCALLQHDISEEKRKFAIRFAKRRNLKLVNSEYDFEKKAASALSVGIAIIENAPARHGHPMATVAASTKKAWSSLLFSEKHSDIEFVFKTPSDNEESNKRQAQILYAHRNILAASSSYFAAFCEGEWGARRRFDTSNTIEIMRTVLKYIYTGDIPPKDELSACALDLLSIASEYGIEDLVQLASNTIQEELTLDNVKDAFKLANLYDCKNLKRGCGAFVCQNASQAMFDERICGLKQEDPEMWDELQRSVAAAMAGSTID